jgi:hypothetical protein
MKWRVDKARCEAMSPEGYRLTWAKHPKFGMHYNAYAPRVFRDPTNGRSIEAGYDRAKVIKACELHMAAHAPELV